MSKEPNLNQCKTEYGVWFPGARGELSTSLIYFFFYKQTLKWLHQVTEDFLGFLQPKLNLIIFLVVLLSNWLAVTSNRFCCRFKMSNFITARFFRLNLVGEERKLYCSGKRADIQLRILYILLLQVTPYRIPIYIHRFFKVVGSLLIFVNVFSSLFVQDEEVNYTNLIIPAHLLKQQKYDSNIQVFGVFWNFMTSV